MIYRLKKKVDYRYNIRGWLKSINDVEELTPSSDPTDLFAFKISYNEVENDQGGMITPLYNGNISETFWKTDSDNIKRNYGYQYDALNRLTNSIYQKDNLPTNSYNEVIWYDPNGNITNLYRTGYQDGTDQNIPFEIDDLVYGYATNSNQLLSVYDQSLKLDGFKDGNPNGIDFEYDLNGNMVKDRNKQIHSIKYNHLNLPTNITFENGSLINYIYNAVGVKLAKIVGTVIAPQELSQYEVHYVGGFQYRNDTPLGEALQFFPTAEGYVSVVDGEKFNYVFNYTDHLGNIRASYTYDQNDQQLKILEESHYYPFGLKHSNYNTDVAKYKHSPDGISVVVTSTERSEYQYKFQEQERQDELGLNWDSFKWRNYDFAIGRFMSIDPLAEKYSYQSPYNFAENKVIWSRELEGLESWYTTSGSTNPNDDPMRKPQSGPLTDNYAKDAGYASYGVTEKQFVDNGVGDKLVENISNMTDSELNPHVDCFAVAKSRINQAFEEVTGEGLPNTKEFNKQWNVVGRDAKAAEGSAGALSDAGLGDFKNRSQIINGELKPGAAVQIFSEKTIEASAFGHSFIFLNYTKTQGNITGMNVADQGWLNGRNVSLEYPTMSGANLGVTVETLVKKPIK